MEKGLIIYFSRAGENYNNGWIANLKVGNTEVMANILAKAVNAPLFKVEPVKEYPFSYDECVEIAKKEKEQNSRPEVLNPLKSIAEYDTIFIGYPIWWGTLPMPMFTQLESLDFSGKTIVPFCTHEGSGFASSIDDLKKICKGANFLEGFSLEGNEVEFFPNKIEEWAKSFVKQE